MSIPTPETDAVVKRIFNKLDTDIRDRRGLKHEWSSIDEDVMRCELRPAWERIIHKEIATIAHDRDAWKAKAERTCKSKLHNQLGWDFYVTDCGYRFQCTDPIFCPNCGGQIVKEGQ